MAQSNEITAAMQQYIGEHAGDLLTLAYQSLDVKDDVTFYPDVKNKLIMTNFEMDDLVKPFSDTFSAPADKFRFVPRELDVKVAKAELTVSPEKYRQTYLAQFMTKGVSRTPEDLPFSQYILETVFKKFGEELNNQTAYGGVYNAAGTTAVDVADGFGTILAGLITATTVTPNTLGALTNANALSKLRTLAKTVPAKYQTPSWQWKMYMSKKSWWAYQENLEALNVNTGRGDDMLKPVYLRGFEGVIELKPVTWMGASDRIILTPKTNMVMGADALTGDLAKMNIINQMWSFDIGVAAALGFNFRYPGLIYCNELA